MLFRSPCCMSTANLDEKNAQLEKPAQIDWNALKHESLQPGGFGDQRSRLWPLLLGVDTKDAEDILNAAEEEVVHDDERQIRLDTDRSFVMYPVG